MTESKKGVFYTVSENAPVFSILTSMIYLVSVFINYMSGGAINSIMPLTEKIMLFGALVALPLAVFDITFTGLSVGHTDVIMMGFTNYFALLIDYATTNWTKFKEIVNYVKYIYLGLFIIALIYMIVSYLTYKSRKQQHG